MRPDRESVPVGRAKGRHPGRKRERWIEIGGWEAGGRDTQRGSSISGCTNLPVPFREIIFVDPFTRVWCRLSPFQPPAAKPPFPAVPFSTTLSASSGDRCSSTFFVSPSLFHSWHLSAFVSPGSFLSAILCFTRKPAYFRGVGSVEHRKPRCNVSE